MWLLNSDVGFETLTCLVGLSWEMVKRSKIFWINQNCSTALKIDANKFGHTNFNTRIQNTLTELSLRILFSLHIHSSLGELKKKTPLSTNTFIYGLDDIHFPFTCKMRDPCASTITQFQETKRTGHGFTTQITAQKRRQKIKRQRLSAIQTKWHNENLSPYYPHTERHIVRTFVYPLTQPPPPPLPPRAANPPK